MKLKEDVKVRQGGEAVKIELVSGGSPESLVKELNRYLQKYSIDSIEDIKFQQAVEPSGASMFYAYVILEDTNRMK